jgi:UDP-4-amino-4,6-dideoxy-N-acetyl-beta-L-altrosamine N-acetyltransferase
VSFTAELTADIPPQARQWRNVHTIRKWCRQYTLIDQAHHNDWLERIERDPTIKMFGIYEPNLGDVGVCGLTSIDRVNQAAEFSLYIAPHAQKKGLARQALTLLLLHAFNDHNLNRVWGEVFSGNPALKLFGEIGFKQEGTLEQAYFRDGKFIDVHRIAILRKDFKC